MPALSLRIEFFDGGDEPALIVKPPWWSQYQIRQKYNFRKEFDGTYYDYYLDLSLDLLKEIYQEQAESLNKGIYEDEGWKKLNNKRLLELDDAIASFGKFTKVRICIYEWESGL